jgi:hypothetical protein
LNSARLSKEELTEASSDVLQSQEAETRPPLYVIDIPPVEEDFPHLSGDKQMYIRCQYLTKINARLLEWPAIWSFRKRVWIENK